MQLTDIRTLFGYDTWATAKIIDQAEHLTAEQYVAPVGANGQSIAQVLAHTLIARHLWRVRFETGETAPTLIPGDFPTLAAFRAGWEREQRAFDAYLATLDDAALGQPVRFTRRGESHAFTRWHLLMQLITHGTQHRAELAEWLTGFGHSPGDLDFFLYITVPR